MFVLVCSTVSVNIHKSGYLKKTLKKLKNPGRLSLQDHRCHGSNKKTHSSAHLHTEMTWLGLGDDHNKTLTRLSETGNKRLFQIPMLCQATTPILH